VTDGDADSNTPTRGIAVTAADDAPVAVSDAATFAQYSNGTAIDVLGNDTDVDGGSKRITSHTDPSHGRVTASDDALEYEPQPDYCNTIAGDAKDTLTYTLNGGSTATVTVTVTCLDTDGDGTPDRLDPDDDNDGVADEQDAFPRDRNESIDTDGDGRGDNAGDDDDNDGVIDAQDAFPNDRSEWADADRDGVGDNADPDGGHPITPPGPPEPPEPPAVQTRLGLSHRGLPRIGTYVRLKLRCRGAASARCKGVLTLDPTAGKRRLDAAAARGRYGRRRFDIAAGEIGTIDVKATPKLLRALRQRHRVIVLASAVFQGHDNATLTIERKLTVVEPRVQGRGG
jgi:hypothetical protein